MADLKQLIYGILKTARVMQLATLAFTNDSVK